MAEQQNSKEDARGRVCVWGGGGRARAQNTNPRPAAVATPRSLPCAHTALTARAGTPTRAPQVSSGTTLHTFSDHKKKTAVACISFSVDGRFVATGGDDAHVYVYGYGDTHVDLKAAAKEHQQLQTMWKKFGSVVMVGAHLGRSEQDYKKYNVEMPNVASALTRFRGMQRVKAWQDSEMATKGKGSGSAAAEIPMDVGGKNSGALKTNGTSKLGDAVDVEEEAAKNKDTGKGKGKERRKDVGKGKATSVDTEFLAKWNMVRKAWVTELRADFEAAEEAAKLTATGNDAGAKAVLEERAKEKHTSHDWSRKKMKGHQRTKHTGVSACTCRAQAPTPRRTAPVLGIPRVYVCRGVQPCAAEPTPALVSSARALATAVLPWYVPLVQKPSCSTPPNLEKPRTPPISCSQTDCLTMH